MYGDRELLQVKKKKEDVSLDEEDDGLKTILWEEVLNHEESWTDYDSKLHVIALEVERLIFKDLVNEVVLGEASHGTKFDKIQLDWSGTNSECHIIDVRVPSFMESASPQRRERYFGTLKDSRGHQWQYDIVKNSGLPLCAWGSNAYKKIACNFGKFLFFEKEDSSALSSEIGSWCIKIIDDYIDLSSNDNIKDVDTSSESIDDHSVDDLEYIQTNLNNIVNQVSEQKMDNNEENKQGEEDIHLIVPQQPPKEEANNKESNPECKAESSDLSRPHGFEFMKKSSFPSSKCTTSFARFRKKDIKGVSLIHELNQIIDVGNSLGYDVRGLVDLPIGGRCFTWMNKAGYGRILTLSSFMLTKLILAPLFKLYNSWLLRDGFDDLIKSEWDSPDSNNFGFPIKCHEKFRILKDKIRQWNNNNKTMERNRKAAALEELSSIEKKIDEGSASPLKISNRHSHSQVTVMEEKLLKCLYSFIERRPIYSLTWEHKATNKLLIYPKEPDKCDPLF
ncbi:RNA-directed DNA polymerase, eukaryota, reverse transcriptase zinc-binding domain protein [Tanacetum coccineum]